MINTVIWGLESDISKYAFTMLEQEGRISIKAWFGEKTRSTVVTHYCYEWERGIFEATAFFGCEESIYSEVYKNVFTFLDMYSRNFKNDHFCLHDGLNVFNILVDMSYGILKKNQIDLVIFYNIPHLGPDYVFYCVAKAMNIQTIMVTQSLFPDRFFFVYDIDDFGLFNKTPVFLNEPTLFNIPKQFKKDLFYMQANCMLTHNDVASVSQKPCKIFDLSSWIKKRRNTLRQSGQKYLDLTDMFLSKRIKKLLKKKMKAAYQKRIRLNFAATVDLTAKFVYFPLHMQPEMTTSSLGGIYCDQILAIERLVSWLPEDWFVYVKENPYQTEFMRGSWFFKRLQRIPRVKLINARFNTYDLIENCQFVATITGTAGWEAISGGKNTVIFGKAWYQQLPGVFIFSEDLLLESVLRYTIDHQELEEKVALLMKKTVPGVVDPLYAQIVDNYDVQVNNFKLLEFFRFVLDHNFSQQGKRIIENT